MDSSPHSNSSSALYSTKLVQAEWFARKIKEQYCKPLLPQPISHLEFHAALIILLGAAQIMGWITQKTFADRTRETIFPPAADLWPTTQEDHCRSPLGLQGGAESLSADRNSFSLQKFIIKHHRIPNTHTYLNVYFNISY